MKGAICGDVIGSRFEGCHHNTTKKDFKLVADINGRGHGSRYTDDSLFTAAVADALLNLTDEEMSDDTTVISRVAEYLIKYRDIDKAVRDCGHDFKQWLYSDTHKPYHGWSNGAVMRCGSAGFLAKSADDAYRLGGLTACPTHNSPEAIKAASVLSKSIYLLRHGATKEDIKSYFAENYDIPTVEWAASNSRIYLDSDNSYHCNLSAEYTLKAAFASFLESNDFESTVRQAVLLGGDSDTIAAVAGSIAESYYGVPDEIWDKVQDRLSKEILYVVWKFYKRVSEMD